MHACALRESVSDSEDVSNSLFNHRPKLPGFSFVEFINHHHAMNVTHARSRELRLTFLAGNEDIRRQRAALTRDISMLEQRFKDFKAEQWLFFPQTRNYHANNAVKAMQNLAQVCLFSFSPISADTTGDTSTERL